MIHSGSVGKPPYVVCMIVFVDFEASSLAKASFPVEVAWVFENGAARTSLIRPASGWDDWSADA